MPRRGGAAPGGFVRDASLSANEHRPPASPDLADARPAGQGAAAPLTLLAEASAALASNLNSDVTLERVAHLAVPALADWCFVDVLEDDGALRRVATAHADPDDPVRRAVARRAGRAFAHPAQHGNDISPALAAGKSYVVPAVTDDVLTALAQDADHVAVLRALDMHALVIAPLVARGRLLGTLTFVAAGGRAAYGADDLPLFDELARRAALAVDAARLYAAERRARRAAELAATRAEQLQRVTAALARALTPADVTEVVVRQGAAALGAAAGAIALRTEDGAVLKYVHAVGYAPEVVARWRRFPVHAPTPFSDAVRNGEPVWLGDYGAWDAQYPGLAVGARATGYAALVALPVVHDGEAARAVLGLSFRDPRPFDADERQFLGALARQAAAALERATLYARAESARAEAEDARRAAEDASKTKSEFLATMSHELRTPLSAVIGYAGLLSDGITGPVNEAQRLQLGRIDASARHLLALIEEVLSFAKLEAGRESVRVETVDAAALTREAAALVLPVAEVKGLALRIDVSPAPARLQTDPKKLRQILLNLLGNAVRYTERGEVALSLRREAGLLRWDVRDTGVGIAPEHQVRIFEAFYQVDQSLTRRQEGTGLGLSVTRQIATLLGGDVAVESAVGVGSTFTVWLPARRATDAPAADAPAADRDVADGSPGDRNPTHARTERRRA